MVQRLYKAKADHNDEWVFGYYLEVGGVPFILPEGKPLNAIVQVRRDTVCQSVGLGDMDGTPVFEGDRLQFSYEDDGEEVVSSSVVVYHDYEFVSVEEEFGMWDSLEGEFLKLCKVTGNIHDEEDGYA